MADSRAGLWIIGIAIYYFLFFIMALALTSSVDTDTITVNDDRIQYLGSLGYDGYCDNYELPTLSRLIDDKRVGTRDINCAKLGFDNADQCNDIVGCNWTNTTTFLFFWEVEVPAFCDGEINLSAYHNETIASTYTISSFDVCKVNNASADEALCATFGCRYYDAGLERVGIGFIWEAISFMFTFSVDIDSPNEYAFILSLFFTWLPLFALVIAIYNQLPFI